MVFSHIPQIYKFLIARMITTFFLASLASCDPFHHLYGLDYGEISRELTWDVGKDWSKGNMDRNHCDVVEVRTAPHNGKINVINNKVLAFSSYETNCV